jgi:archaemetzincin
MAQMPSGCHHKKLLLQSSSYAATAKYFQPDASKLAAAATVSGRVGKSSQFITTKHDPSTYPAPLILPEDDLAYDPKQPGQSVRAWIQMQTRNDVTSRRKTLYIVNVPRCDDASLNRRLENWTRPSTEKKSSPRISNPSMQDVAEYLQAFYHGMNIQKVDDLFSFTTWDDEETPSAETPGFIGLVTKKDVVRIRTRACRDGAFQGQLNLNDLLDACIDSLPPDAFSMVLLTDLDLYEDEEDDFCCGRAFGGSRVAVVSSARYHPLLDIIQNVEQEHPWPVSHCHARRNIGIQISSASRRHDRSKSAFRTLACESLPNC